MKNFILIIISIIFIGCNKYDYKIYDLNKEKIKFENLPKIIIDYINNRKYSNAYSHQTTLVVLDSNDTSRYTFEIKSSFVKSWVDYIKLIDVEQQITYKINHYEPEPFIIFQNKLYIPDRYNMFTTVDDVKSLMFTRYDLK